MDYLKRKTIWITAVFSLAIRATRGQWNNMYKVLRENNLQPRFSTQIPFKGKNEIFI